MAKLIFLPAMVVGLTALYMISRHRHVEVEFEAEVEPREPAGGTIMEAGIE